MLFAVGCGIKRCRRKGALGQAFQSDALGLESLTYGYGHRRPFDGGSNILANP
jgi:hypothetical protein